MPLVDFLAEDAASLPRDAVVARASIVLRHPPLALDVAAMLEALEGGVERALVDVEALAGELVDAEADPPAMHRIEREGLEDEEVDAAAKGVGFLRVARHGVSSRSRD